MTPEHAGPISRPFPLHRVTPVGVDAEVVASEAEMRALAADLDLVGLRGLVARYRITGTARRVRVTGEIRATVGQTCVVSLDPFETVLREDVEVEFETPPARGRVAGPDGDEVEADLDRPDELVGDRLDLGAITAEFLALALDPHPRKPGVAFAGLDAAPDASSAFAGLAALRSAAPKPDES